MSAANKTVSRGAKFNKKIHFLEKVDQGPQRGARWKEVKKNLPGPCQGANSLFVDISHEAVTFLHLPCHKHSVTPATLPVYKPHHPTGRTPTEIRAGPYLQSQH